MPEYDWVCHVCEASNQRHTDACLICHTKAELNAQDISARKLVYRINKLKCELCGEPVDAKLSDDDYNSRMHLFRILYVEATCIGCGQEHFFEKTIPFARRWYRSKFGETKPRWFFYI